MQEKLLVLLLKIGACSLERLTGKEVALRWGDANGGLGDGCLRWLLFRGFWREDQVLEKDFGSVFWYEPLMFRCSRICQRPESMLL